MVKARKYIVAQLFKGEIKDDDLQIVEEDLPEVNEHEFLVEALYISVDPYQRAYSRTIGETMVGYQVAKVIESKSRKYPEGAIVVSHCGWRTHTILSENDEQTYLLPNIGNLPLSLGVGMLGMPGNTAYFGLLDICKPEAGETVVVTGAAGAVGSHVGQIAKIKGCRVIGFAGSDDKCEWLKSIGFDHVINYKTTSNIAAELKKAAPNGVDCYFDNVGGAISSTILYQMNQFGRIAVCGSISAYNDLSLPEATIVQPAVVSKSLTMRGFVVTEFAVKWSEAIRQNLEWLKEGKLQYKETVTEGFDNLLEALKGLFKGSNTGKAVVKVGSTNVESHTVGFKDAFKRFNKMNM